MAQDNKVDKLPISPDIQLTGKKEGDGALNASNRITSAENMQNIPESSMPEGIKDLEHEDGAQRVEISTPQSVGSKIELNQGQIQESVESTISGEYIRAKDSLSKESLAQGEVSNDKSEKLPKEVAPKTGEIGMDLNIATASGATYQNTQLSQVLKHISGYQAAGFLTTGDPKFPAQVQNTATNGDPNKSDTWQASLILKILTVFFNMFK